LLSLLPGVEEANGKPRGLNSGKRQTKATVEVAVDGAGQGNCVISLLGQDFLVFRKSSGEIMPTKQRLRRGGPILE